MEHLQAVNAPERHEIFDPEASAETEPFQSIELSEWEYAFKGLAATQVEYPQVAQRTYRRKIGQRRAVSEKKPFQQLDSADWR